MLALLLTSAPLRLVPHGPYVRSALAIATRFDRTLYESLYVALALAEQATLVTADTRLVAALASSEIGGFVVSLSEMSL